MYLKNSFKINEEEGHIEQLPNTCLLKRSFTISYNGHLDFIGPASAYLFPFGKPFLPITGPVVFVE